MEIDFSKVEEYKVDLKQVLLDKIGEEQIIGRYIGELNYNSPILSPLRKERNPSFTIKKFSDGKVVWKDWGTGKYGDCFNLVQELYNCSFNEALKIIMSDFQIRNYDRIPFIRKEEVIATKKKEKYILVKKQPFTRVDKEYWNKFGISLNTLTKFNVSSVKELYLFRENDIIFNKYYSSSCPIYAYQFNSYKTENYKIYMPFADKKHKWLFNGSSSDVEGYSELPLYSNLLILTKSLKDVMAYWECGYSAISLQGEHNKLDKEFLQKLYGRFDNILVNYDLDDAGIKAAKALNIEHGLSYFTIDEGKDLSGYIELYSKDRAKEMLYNIIGI
jgi:DNA primase